MNTFPGPFALLFLFLGQNTALLSNFTMLLAYCTIAWHVPLPVSLALPGSIAKILQVY
jgi:hypothetical protein